MANSALPDSQRPSVSSKNASASEARTSGRGRRSLTARPPCWYRSGSRRPCALRMRRGYPSRLQLDAESLSNTKSNGPSMPAPIDPPVGRSDRTSWAAEHRAGIQAMRATGACTHLPPRTTTPLSTSSIRNMAPAHLSDFPSANVKRQLPARAEQRSTTNTYSSVMRWVSAPGPRPGSWASPER